jgi:hypothetical protein
LGDGPETVAASGVLQQHDGYDHGDQNAKPDQGRAARQLGIPTGASLPRPRRHGERMAESAADAELPPRWTAGVHRSAGGGGGSGPGGGGGADDGG